jgi:hypothetical protein
MTTDQLPEKVKQFIAELGRVKSVKKLEQAGKIRRIRALEDIKPGDDLVYLPGPRTALVSINVRPSGIYSGLLFAMVDEEYSITSRYAEPFEIEPCCSTNGSQNFSCGLRNMYRLN